jgi:hypothetical protein
MKKPEEGNAGQDICILSNKHNVHPILSSLVQQDFSG